jgi:hypothetical protein
MIFSGKGKTTVESVQQEKAKESQVWQVFMMLIVVLMLLAFGAVFAFLGWRAIEQRHYEAEWESVSGGFGISRTSHGIETLDGTAAVLIGVSFISFGVMMITWGVGFAAGFAHRYLPASLSQYLHMLGWFSFLCLIVGMICLYPPWELSDTPFNVVVALWLVLFFLPDAMRKWGRPLFIGEAVVAIALGQFKTGIISTQIIMGIFASLAVVTHILILFPKFMEKRFNDEKVT